MVVGGHGRKGTFPAQGRNRISQRCSEGSPEHEPGVKNFSQRWRRVTLASPFTGATEPPLPGTRNALFFGRVAVRPHERERPGVQRRRHDTGQKGQRRARR